jgi:CRP-like cAMP-binding protein
LTDTELLKELKTYLDRLHPISETAWSKLKALFKEERLRKGEYFIRQGQTAKDIGFLQEGIIRAFYANAEGQEYNKHFFIPPCFTGGYASLITGQANQINQEALTDCSLLVANYEDFKALYREHPDIERAARVLAELFFVQKEQREIEIVLLDADERYRIFQKEFSSLENAIPQYHIASYLGITPTQLSRIRRKLAGR